MVNLLIWRMNEGLFDIEFLKNNWLLLWFYPTVYLPSPSHLNTASPSLKLIRACAAAVVAESDTVVFNNQIRCDAKRRDDTDLGVRNQLQSTAVVFLMAQPGSLNSGQQPSGLLARSARSFTLGFSRSIAKNYFGALNLQMPYVTRSWLIFTTVLMLLIMFPPYE